MKHLKYFEANIDFDWEENEEFEEEDESPFGVGDKVMPKGDSYEILKNKTHHQIGSTASRFKYNDKPYEVKMIDGEFFKAVGKLDYYYYNVDEWEKV